GASNVAQAGGCAVFDTIGLQEIAATTQFYLENAKILVAALKHMDCEVYGGINAPYLWVRFKGQKSWDIFQRFLEHYHIVTTPGSGFGSQGEEFIRLTAFGQREHILKAIDRLKQY